VCGGGDQPGGGRGGAGRREHRGMVVGAQREPGGRDRLGQLRQYAPVPDAGGGQGWRQRERKEADESGVRAAPSGAVVRVCDMEGRRLWRRAGGEVGAPLVRLLS